MTSFTPFSALIGGFFIGLAAAVLMLSNGRVAGISGITSGLFLPWCKAQAWRGCFLVGLILAPLLYKSVGGSVVIEIHTPLPVIILAGLLVGYGTRLGNGCTSGHGVCGLARFSPRSAAATATFMATAGITLYIARHLIGWGN